MPARYDDEDNEMKGVLQKWWLGESIRRLVNQQLWAENQPVSWNNWACLSNNGLVLWQFDTGKFDNVDNLTPGQFDNMDNLTPDNLTMWTIWHRTIWHRTIWHRGQFDTVDNLTPDNLTPDNLTPDNLTPHTKTDNLTPRTIWHRGQFYTISKKNEDLFRNICDTII